MKVVALETTELTLPELLKLAKAQTIVLTRRGKPLASVKGLTKSDWESIALANNPRFQKLIEESRRSYVQEGGITVSDLRTELGLKPLKRRRAKREADSKVSNKQKR